MGQETLALAPSGRSAPPGVLRATPAGVNLSIRDDGWTVISGNPAQTGEGVDRLIRRPREAIHVETPATPLKLGGRAGRLIFRLVLEDRVAVGVRCEGYAEVPEQSLHQPEVAVWSLPARRTGR